MALTITKDADLTLVCVPGPDIDEQHAAELAFGIEELVGTATKRIAVVLAAGTEAHSELIGLLIKCARIAGKAGARLAVVHPDEAFHVVARMCRLDRAILFVKSAHELSEPHVDQPCASPEDVVRERTLARPCRGRKCILLVDDQERLLDSTREVLLFLGYDACEAHDGKEALEVFEARRREIDLVLMDIGMPRMNGIDAFKAMIRIDPNARVVLMSGDYPGEESRKLRGLGLKGFVRKPFTVNQLAADVGAALETSR